VAKRLRIPKRRQQALNALAEEYVRQLRTERQPEARTVIEEEKKRKNAPAAD
jgi:hypothetical protein